MIRRKGILKRKKGIKGHAVATEPLSGAYKYRNINKQKNR
jgi:hypothetical protein